MKKTKSTFNILIIALVLLSACSTAGAAKSSTILDVLPAGDIDSSAGNNQSEPDQNLENGEPDYDVAFPQDAVNEITITISSEDWNLMLKDMAELYGEQGSNPAARSGQKADPAAGDVFPPPGNEGPRKPPPDINVQQAGVGRLGGEDDQNPVWVESEVSFDGENWEHVGIRFKGNSSLRSTWVSGSLKLPFKLDFDQYEDEYPETDDQRFYGFKQISFSSGFHDDSMLREKIAADIFREAGVPSAQTAYYAVTVDYGEGPVYFGIYTAVEVVDDTLIETQFSDDSGNVYKPEGPGATFAAGSFSEVSFDKETNQDENDYSDILTLFKTLHDQTRISDPESWRENLESIFDVDTFLNWLAVNTVIQNWDTYGVMNHNYYLYNNPETGQLVWIPWDNNESLKTNGQMRDRETLPLDLSGVGDNWPLVSYLRDDPVYYQKYLLSMDGFLEDVFNLEELADTYQYFHDLVAPYVLEEGLEYTQISSSQAFDKSVAELIQHSRERIETAENFLANQ